MASTASSIFDMVNLMKDASILVTGGTGSFAHAFVKRVLPDNPKRLVLYSRDEQKQEQMAREFSHPALRFLIGDVRDRDRLDLALRGIDLVIHAAAMKIVPTCEREPEECTKTNVIGSMNVARAALDAGVQRVIALSTDKACNPINHYGATKLAAEKHFVAYNNIAAGNTVYSVVRYGNVIGSRGSVIPLFRQRVAEGRPLPITDPRMTRFWLTLDQAVEFVLTSIPLMKGGEVMVPKIPSMRITDLAEAVAPGHPCEFIGIRPGEKLHETLVTEDEARTTDHLRHRYIVRTSGHDGGNTWGAYTSDLNDQVLSVDDLRALISDGDTPKDWRVTQSLTHLPGSQSLFNGGGSGIMGVHDPL